MTCYRAFVALLAGAGCGAVLGADPGLSDSESDSQLPDGELLEFLGSWEGEEDEWQEFFDNLPAVLDDTSPINEQANSEERNAEEDGQ